MSSFVTELGGTIQASHIREHPDPRQDITPSTAAEKKEVVTLHRARRSSSDASLEDDDVPYSVLRRPQRLHNLPPLPDMRFEQSYLHSIAAADTWWKVMLITTRDQVNFLSPIAFCCSLTPKTQN